MDVSQDASSAAPVVIGRYELHDPIASGGMATVHYGRLAGPAGFSRPVAIKRLHPHLARDPEFVAMFLDEARLAVRIQHLNVVPTLDVVASKGEVFLVMEFVQGETLSTLWRKSLAAGERIAPRIVGSVMTNTLHGLHAAHEAKNEQGQPLRIVHRDVSPQNIILSPDGVARVLDFGVAKAVGRLQTTRQGSVKGKFAYMAPEQLDADTTLDRRVDVFAAGVVCWELLAGRRLFQGDQDAVILARVMTERPGPVTEHNPDLPPEIDSVLDRALARNRDERYATARAFADDIERVLGVAPASVVGDWVLASAGTVIEQRAAKLLEIERSSNNNSTADPLLQSVLEGKRIPSMHPNESEKPPPASPAEGTVTVAESTPSRGKSAVPIVGALLMVGVLVGVSLAFAITRSEPGEPAGTFLQPLARLSASPPHAVNASSSPAGTARPVDGGSLDARTIPDGSSPAPPRPAYRHPPPPRATKTATPANCDPPYTLDANGHKIWKRHCLR